MGKAHEKVVVLELPVGYTVFKEIADTVEVCVARCAIGQGDAVEQEGRGKRTKQEVFHARFLRATAARNEATQNVEGQRQHLDTEEDGQEAGRRRQKHHADGGEQASAHSIRPDAPVSALQIRGREQDTEHTRAQDDEVAVKRSPVGTDHVVEATLMIAHDEENNRCGDCTENAEALTRGSTKKFAAPRSLTFAPLAAAADR